MSTLACLGREVVACDWEVLLLSFTYLGSLHLHHLAAKEQGNGLVAPADAADLLPRMVRDHVEDEGVHAQNPGVPAAWVGVAAADDDQVERGRVGEVVGALGWVEEGELGIVGDGVKGARVRVPDLVDVRRAVRVEQDGDSESLFVGRGHVE